MDPEHQSSRSAQARQQEVVGAGSRTASRTSWKSSLAAYGNVILMTFFELWQNVHHLGGQAQ
jgi:hypothetical protein